MKLTRHDIGDLRIQSRWAQGLHPTGWGVEWGLEDTEHSGLTGYIPGVYKTKRSYQLFSKLKYYSPLEQRNLSQRHLCDILTLVLKKTSQAKLGR